MPERFCPNCREPAGDARYCPECGEHLAEAEGAEDSGDMTSPPVDRSKLPPPPPPEDEPPVPSREVDDVPDREPSDEEFAPPEMRRESEITEEPAAEEASDRAYEPGPVPADGQLRCGHCGETAYKGEVVCWACGRRLDESHEETQVAEPEEGPVAEPESGARVVQEEAEPPSAERVPVTARPQAPAGEEPSAEATAYAWWSFGLGLMSVLTCGFLGLLGVAAIWLGVMGARKDAGPMAVAGMVLGALGLVMLLALIVAAVLMLRGGTGVPPGYVLLPFGFYGGHS